MNIFTQHPHQQGISYTEHLQFALGIAKRLLDSVIAFTLHGLFPFIDINKSLDLEATGIFIREQNHWIESMKQSKQTDSRQTSFLQNRKLAS